MKNNVRSYFKNIPVIGPLCWKLYHRWRYKNTIKLIDGKLRHANTHASIIHFSFNRSATQYVKSILKQCAERKGMIHIRLNEYAFNSSFPFLDHLSASEMKRYSNIFKPRGYLYSSFGGMIDGIPELEKYKVIFITRDPRDLLVSKYFGISYSHPAPNKIKSNKRENFLKTQIKAHNNSIDEFVLEQSDELCNQFKRYQRLLISKYSHVYVTSYEYMITDFKNWLSDLLAYCNFEINDDLFESLLKNHKRKRPDDENKYKHNRKGIVGDYKEKLKPETIAALNKKFAPILDSYGYTP